MADEFDQFKVRAPTGGDEFDQFKVKSDKTPAAPTFGQQAMLGVTKSLQSAVDVGVGAAKELGTEALHLGQFGRMPFGVSKEQRDFEAGLERKLKTTSTEQKVGAGVMQAAEYLPPLGEEKVISQVPAGLRVLSRIALDAFRTGATATVQAGDVKTGVEAGATAGVASGLFAGLGKAAGVIGRKIQASTIRPRAVDMIDGFKWETLDKFKLKGNLQQSLDQVDGQLTKLRTERNGLLAPGASNVDLNSVFPDIIKEVQGNAADLKYGHMGTHAVEGVQSMQKDLEEILGGKMNVDISQAENLKEFLGTLGAWSYGRGDPEAKVSELVANTAYSKMRAAIENSLGTQGPRVHDLNRQMQELIPVKHAMLSRLPVEERNRMFSLSDIAALLPAIATGDPRMLALEGLTRAQKSLRFGNWLNRAVPGAKASAAARLTGAALTRTGSTPEESTTGTASTPGR